MTYLDADVTRYLREQVVAEDDALHAIGAKARELGVPAIAPEAGRVLQLLCRLIGARRVLEIGTCTGYSGIWIARGLPADGHLETLELDPQRAAMARAHFRQAGVAERVTVTVGDAVRRWRPAPTKVWMRCSLTPTSRRIPSILKRRCGWCGRVD